jgi:LysR family glycine cleavage system transcriptional activator
MGLPDLESLACVDALARTLRFHVAARSRFLSAAAFSKRVQQVEEHVGEPLFARTTRTVELTEAGAALLPQIRKILDKARVLSAGAAHAQAGRETPIELTLGTRHELGMSWLMPARRALRQDMPHLTMHLRFGNTDELEHAVLTLRTDAIVTSHAPSTKRLDSLPLHREDYAFVASPRLLRTTPLAHANDAGAHTLIDAHDDLPLFAYLRATGLPLRFAHVLVLGTIAAIREAVLDGEGVAVLPRYFVAPDLARKRLVTVLPTARLGHDFFRLVFRADDARRPLLERLARTLKSRALA